MPVTTADRSWKDWGFFISLRYSHSKKTHPATDTAVRVRARRPKLKQAYARAGSIAMMTSFMMPWVVSLPRMWGEEVAISLRFL